MPFDIAIDGNGDSYLDSGNDLAIVDGNSRLEQHVYLNVAEDVLQLLGQRLNGDVIAEAEELIRESLNDAEDIDEVVSVSIDEYDPSTNSIVATATSRSGDVQTVEIGT